MTSIHILKTEVSVVHLRVRTINLDKENKKINQTDS